jgi:thioredoxin family protein
MKRNIEVFTAGCPLCDPVVNMVKETACENCEITVYDLIEQCEDEICLDKVKAYGVKNVPSVVVDGKLLDCCNREITREDLISAGVGQSL